MSDPGERQNTTRAILFWGVGFLTVAFMVLAAFFADGSPGGGGGGGSPGSGGSGRGGGGTGQGTPAQAQQQPQPPAPQTAPAPPQEAPPQEDESLMLSANLTPPPGGEVAPAAAAAPSADGGGGSGGGDGSGTGSGSGSGSGTGSGSGSGSGQGAGKGEFMGTEAVGNSFVYVVDCSGSMQGELLALAKQELVESINALTRDQLFFVYFYSSSETPMPPPPGAAPGQLIPATRRNREHCVQWAYAITAGGGTNPENALLGAVRLRPAAVFLMTDGAFSLNPSVLSQLQSSGVPVHTIAFMNRSGEAMLQQIATQTRGRYRFYAGRP